MKKLALIAAAVALLGTGAIAQHGSKKVQGHKLHKTMKMSRMSSTMKCMMTDLTPEEKKIAHGMMKKMSKAEMAVMMKRCSMCMKDSHAGMMDGGMTDDMEKQHMMSGLSKSEQATFMKCASKMSHQEHNVGKRMVMNCCMYGAKHAGK